MQGKSKYYFPPYFMRKQGFWFPGSIKLVSHKKRNPASAHLSTLRQGSSTNRITNKEDVVKAQESGATPTGGQRKKINIPLVSLAL